MDYLPAEIWGDIYALACVDDGRTGRALSLVSRFIHETSKPYKLQSIAVIGERQLLAFADLIEQTPTHLRRVHFILFSSSAPQVTLDHLLISANTRQLDLYPVLERILRAISSTVRIIHALFLWQRPFILLPVSLPVLEELVMQGPIHMSATVNDSIQLPALKHLNFACNAALLENLLKLTPSLINLQLTAAIQDADGLPAIVESGFPIHLQRISIHTPTRPYPMMPEHLLFYNRVMHSLQLLADADHRVLLLYPLRFDLLGTETLMATWSASVAGIPWW